MLPQLALLSELLSCTYELNPPAINQAILAVIPRQGFYYRYVYHFVEWVMEKAAILAQGGQPNLNAGIIKSVSVYMPSVDEQLVIANCLDAAASELRKLEQLSLALMSERQVIMQQLLSGKRRVKLNPVA